MKILICLAAIALTSGCSDDAPSKTTTVTPELTAAVDATLKPRPPPPTHNYAVEEDGEYGYERSISEDEAKAGKVTSAVLMVRYLGKKDGTITIQMIDGQTVDFLSCKAPCEFVKGRTYFAGQLMKTETTRNAPNSVLWAVMQDAQNGQMKKYEVQRNK